MITGELDAHKKIIQAQTLIINGENDILFPLSETAELFKYIAQAQSIIIPRASHSIHIDNPEDFSNSVISFCNLALTDFKN